MTKLLCDKIIRCSDNSNRPCVRLAKHEGGCNPFITSAPTLGDEEGKRDSVDRIEVIYHRALKAAQV